MNVNSGGLLARRSRTESMPFHGGGGVVGQEMGVKSLCPPNGSFASRKIRHASSRSKSERATKYFQAGESSGCVTAWWRLRVDMSVGDFFGEEGVAHGLGVQLAGRSGGESPKSPPKSTELHPDSHPGHVCHRNIV
jgi:hypothetical protein